MVLFVKMKWRRRKEGGREGSRFSLFSSGLQVNRNSAERGQYRKHGVPGGMVSTGR